MREDAFLSNLLRVIAVGLGGGYQPGDHYRPPWVRLRVEDVVGQVVVARGRIGRRTGPPYTTIGFSWKPAGLLRIGLETLLTRISKLFGTQDVQIGDAEFDRRFLIQGHSVHWVRRTLNERTRLAIRTLADTCQRGRNAPRLTIDLGPAGLKVLCWDDLSDEPVRLAQFAEAGVELMKALYCKEGAGVEILGVEESSSAGVCPTCGDTLRAPLRRCSACRTLHHQDCWEYLGGCAIFACSSARGRRAEQQAARRATAAMGRRTEAPTRRMQREEPPRRRTVAGSRPRRRRRR